MDIRRFLTIAWWNIRLILTDRAALVIMVGTPLVLTFVLGAAFSGISGSGDSPIKNIPVIVVNADKGATFGPQTVNFGKTLTDALNSTGGLIKLEEMSDEAAAKIKVQQGNAAAAVFIPADFSQAWNPTAPTFGDNKINLTIYRSSGDALSADIVVAVMRQVLNTFMSTNTALYAAGKAGADPLFFMTQAGTVAQEVAVKTVGDEAPIRVETKTSGTVTPRNSFNLLSFFAPAMAVFFLNFMVAFGAISLLEEKESGTLSRLMVSPTQKATILAGKLGGVYFSGVLQLVSLMVATTLFSPLLGATAPIWGNNIPALAVTVLVVTAGAMGMGTLIASLAKNRQQAMILTSTFMILIGMVGGTFGTPPTSGVLGFFSRLTVNYWAIDAFTTLAQKSDLTAILPNLGVLMVIFIVMFSIGATIFNRRLEV